MFRSLLLLCSLGFLALHAADAPADLGRTMFVGDSITHGINTPSYRWDFHKILADNGVRYEAAGYTTNNFQRGKGNGVNLAPPAYRGVPFANRHSAHEGGQIWQLFEPENTEYTQPSTGRHYITKSGVKYPGQTIGALVQSQRASTYCVLLGTNDIIQNFHVGGSFGKGDNLVQAMEGILGVTEEGDGYAYSGKGTLDTLVDAMLAGKATKRVVVMALIPPGRKTFSAEDHAAIAAFNEVLQAWAAHKGVLFAPLGEGTVDVAATPADPYGALEGPRQRVDWIHPGPQTNLIMAGNLARALGYSGRTLGLPRRPATKKAGFARLGKNNGKTFSPAADGSFTLDLGSVHVGNGYEDERWDTQPALTLTLDNGKQRGILRISETYITWGDNTVLYSRDMSRNTDSLRVVYTAGNAAQGIEAGFYIWLGAQLIAEACPAAPSSGTPALSLDGASHPAPMFAPAAYAPKAH
ncbi:MAG: GDSL-type esterase/lipase family protein [Akkermansia sp.]|nr:GDSL-type esterase/lipase family protein [Akkermansia sp.]